MTDKPTIDLARDDLLTVFGKEVLKDRYMLPKEKSPQEALARTAAAFADSDAHAKCYRHQVFKTTDLIVKKLNIPSDKYIYHRFQFKFILKTRKGKNNK